MAGLHLLGVRLTELKDFRRSCLLAVRPLSYDRGRSDAGQIDALDTARRQIGESGRNVSERADGDAHHQRWPDAQGYMLDHSLCLSSEVIDVAWRPMTSLARSCGVAG